MVALNGQTKLGSGGSVVFVLTLVAGPTTIELFALGEASKMCRVLIGPMDVTTCVDDRWKDGVRTGLFAGLKIRR